MSTKLIDPVPYSEDAEVATLGALLANPSRFPSIQIDLNAEDFFFLRHTHIYRAMSRLMDRQFSIDYLTIAQELRDMGKLDEIGGQAYLTYLINNTPSAVHVEVYAQLVARAATRRKLLKAADDIKALALNEEMPIDVVLNESQYNLLQIKNMGINERLQKVDVLISAYYDKFEADLDAGVNIGIPSGFRALDSLLGGWRNSDLIVWGARPSMGKTSILLATALHAAKIGVPIVIFSLEMSHEQLIERLIAMEAGLNIQKLRLKQLTPRESQRWTETVGFISTLPIFIDDTPAISPETIRAKVRRLSYEYHISQVFIDYAGLMDGSQGHKSDPTRQNAYISRALKELAREINIPLHVAVQLNRNLESRKDKRPVMSDIRDSGTWEQDADIINFLYRDEVYDPHMTEFPNQADVITAKHRNGPTGIISLYFEKSLAKFMDINMMRVDLNDLGD